MLHLFELVADSTKLIYFHSVCFMILEMMLREPDNRCFSRGFLHLVKFEGINIINVRILASVDPTKNA